MYVYLYVFQYVVIVVCLKAGLHIQSWSYIVHIAIWGSIATWFAFLVTYRYVYLLKCTIFFFADNFIVCVNSEIINKK